MKILPPESTRRTEFWLNVRAALVLLPLGILAFAFFHYFQWYRQLYISIPPAAAAVLLLSAALLWLALRACIRAAFAQHGMPYFFRLKWIWAIMFFLCLASVFPLYFLRGWLVLRKQPLREETALVTKIHNRRLRYGGRVDAGMQLVFASGKQWEYARRVFGAPWPPQVGGCWRIAWRSNAIVSELQPGQYLPPEHPVCRTHPAAQRR
ncbi:MAG: hypothetical protein IJR28_07530 [Ottowia sp.]|nr:hypothetical protein [Ottowia sp.]